MSESDNWRECFWFGTAVLADLSAFVTKAQTTA